MTRKIVDIAEAVGKVSIERAAKFFSDKALTITDPNLRIVVMTVIDEAKQESLESIVTYKDHETIGNVLKFYLETLDLTEWIGVDPALASRMRIWFKALGLDIQYPEDGEQLSWLF